MTLDALTEARRGEYGQEKRPPPSARRVIAPQLTPRAACSGRTPARCLVDPPRDPFGGRAASLLRPAARGRPRGGLRCFCSAVSQLLRARLGGCPFPPRAPPFPAPGWVPPLPGMRKRLDSKGGRGGSRWSPVAAVPGPGSALRVPALGQGQPPVGLPRRSPPRWWARSRARPP